MDLIPSDMIATIEVNKTLTADMDADAIGGSVNLITRAAPNGERVSFTASGGYSPIREKGNYTSAFVYGNRFLNDKLGMIFSASYNNNNFGSDNVEAVWVKWDENGNQMDYIEELDIRKYDVNVLGEAFLWHWIIKSTKVINYLLKGFTIGEMIEKIDTDLDSEVLNLCLKEIL